VVCANSTIEKRVENGKAVAGMITKERWEERTVKSVGINADAKNLVGHQMEAKNQDML
jgi:hypothetical protein